MSKADAREVEALREQVAAMRREMVAVRGIAQRAGDVRDTSRDDRGPEWQAAAARAAARRRRSLGRRVKRTAFVVTGYIVAGSFVSLDPFKWFDEDAFCGGSSTAATVAAEPAAVKVAKDQGRWLRRLAGPPPDPADTAALAERAADAVVASTLAFRASLTGARDPAAVTAYTAAYRKREAAAEARGVASCAPKCPTGEAGGGGAWTVAYVPAGADPARAKVARDAAVAAGFTGRSLDIALRVAWLESRFVADARNPSSSAAGVWQVMRSVHANDPDIGSWADPFASARMAYRISKGGTDWSPWAVWPAVRRDMAGVPAPVQVASAVPAGDCSPVSPSTYKGGAAEGAWGGHVNGRIPANELAAPAFAPAHRLRPDAAQALQSLAVAYRARFGRALGVTDSYRDYAGQLSCTARKGSLCARPGTSNHGWGLAVDLVVGSYGDARYQWLRDNGPAFGWDNPGWARSDGSKPEPWHWEYNPTGATA